MALAATNPQSRFNTTNLRFWPYVVITAQILIAGIYLASVGAFKPVETNDSFGYIHVKWDSLADVLGNLRTPGYPAFLALLRYVSPDNGAVPMAQFLFYTLSVLLFYAGLHRVTQDSVRSFIAASSLIYSRILFGYISTIATDVVAAGAGVLVCGLLMLRLCSPGLTMSVLLSLAVTAGWLIRPAYLFLVPFVPLMTWMIFPAVKQPVRSRSWHAFTALLLVIAPLLLYSTLRLSVVGRFGIVSFGGGNIVGVAGQFLVESDVPYLSGDLRDIARTAIERRNSGKFDAPEFDDLPATNYMRMESRYDTTIWQLFSSPESGEATQNPVQWNSQMRRLAQELIRRHPREYLLWLIKAFRQAARKLLWDFADNGFSFVLLVLAGTLIVLRGFRLNRLVPAMDVDFVPLTTLSLFAIVYCTMNLAVVIPVCPPLGRFTDSAAILLAAPLAVWIYDAVGLSAVTQNRSTDLRSTAK